MKKPGPDASPAPSSCCSPVLGPSLGKAEAEELALAFKAMSDPARLRLLNHIAAQPSAETCVCFLTEPLGLAQPTVSHHLKVLHDAGLLGREKRGTWVYYRVIPQRLTQLRDALALPSPQPGTKTRAAPRAPKTGAAARA